MLKQTLYLKAGGCLEIHDDYVRFVDRDSREVQLSNAQQTILSVLAQAQGSPVSYNQLYEKYTGQAAMGNVNQCLSKVRNRIASPELKECIHAVNGVGYRLDPAQFVAQPQTHAAVGENDVAWVRHLAGDYYGFYLDPIGDGSILGAYFHIEEYRGEVIVSAILGIQSDKVLRDERLADVFTGEPSGYERNYRELRREFSDNDRRCSFGSGKVTSHHTDAVIKVNLSVGTTWTFLVETSLFHGDARVRQGKYHPYRGGMCVIVALTGVRGIFCARCGLIRRDYMQPTVTLDNPQMKEALKIFGEEECRNSCQPLKLGMDQDKKWYNWFMKGAK